MSGQTGQNVFLKYGPKPGPRVEILSMHFFLHYHRKLIQRFGPSVLLPDGLTRLSKIGDFLDS